MKIKWYISTLILVLTVLGIGYNKISSPNQEILVQFNTNEVTTEQSQSAIASIKLQLLSFGIDDVQVRDDENGKLKITYYSTIDVESIKKTLSKEEDVILDYASVGNDQKSSKLPSDKKSKSYNLDIYELHKSTDGNNGSAGKCVLVVKQDFDRFLNPNSVLPSIAIDVKETDQFVKEAYKVNRAIVITIDNTSRIIPEVRAGPFFIGNI